MKEKVYIHFGDVDEFQTPDCYDLYMHAVSLAEKINNYIDKGWIVIKDWKHLWKFEFYGIEKPLILQNSSIWFGNTLDMEGKVIFSWEYTKKTIENKFAKIKICNPKYFINII